MKRNKGTLIYSFTCLLFSGFTLTLFAQAKITTEQYIEEYKEVAIQKMRDFKIPASITLAQAILESGSGNSTLARKANNHFGIKCHTGWKGGTYSHTDDQPNECFRKYKDPEESYRDHSLFLTQRPRYSGLFLLDIMDYEAWAHGLKKAGYATNPQYADLLIGIIERYNLMQYDDLGLKKMADYIQTLPDLKPFEFIPVNPSKFEVVGKTASGRFIHQNNGVKLIFARENDSIKRLAAELKMYPSQLIRYNDLVRGIEPQDGMMIYVQAKRRRSAITKYHVLSKGESIHAVSQLYGVKLSRMMKMNKIKAGETLKSGTRIRLR